MNNILSEEQRCYQCNESHDVVVVCLRCRDIREIVQKACAEAEKERLQRNWQREQDARDESHHLQLLQAQDKAHREQLTLHTSFLSVKQGLRFWQGLCVSLLALSLFLVCCLVARDPAPVQRQSRILTQELIAARQQNDSTLRAVIGSRCVVNGAGSNDYNGIYFAKGTLNGTILFHKGNDHVLYWDGSQWTLSSGINCPPDACLAYYSPKKGASALSIPTSRWVVSNGVEPAPAVTRLSISRSANADNHR